jgi:hypothetical protein
MNSIHLLFGKRVIDTILNISKMPILRVNYFVDRDFNVTLGAAGMPCSAA